MSSLFTKIINKEVPAYILAENKNFIAFLDINPLNEGHTLVVPKVERDYIFNNSDEVLAQILLFSRDVAKAIEQVIPCTRIGLAVIGLEVPHTHLHLVPINNVGDIDFSRKKLKIDPKRMAEIASAIKALL
ncbi:MAG: histidine triad (HIT) family protein [Sphingobacteriales bacterium]|jgi:histidine triad (HIT) family protein